MPAHEYGACSTDRGRSVLRAGPAEHTREICLRAVLREWVRRGRLVEQVVCFEAIELELEHLRGNLVARAPLEHLGCPELALSSQGLRSDRCVAGGLSGHSWPQARALRP